VPSKASRTLLAACGVTLLAGLAAWDAAARRWAPLMDFTGFDDWNELGVESIAPDPVNPAKVWVAAGEYTQPWAVPLDGEILRSDNRGRSWQITDLPIQLASNQNGRNMGERLAVDPDDDDVLYLASPANGLWRSTDGGATWAQVASFPVTSTPDDTGLSFVTFDALGSHRGAPTKTIFVANATGDDLYESTDSGATWQLVPGEPTGMEPQHGPCKLISAVDDLGGFCHTGLNRSASSGMIEPIIGSGTSVAEAGKAPLDVALVGYDGGDYSTDGGRTFGRGPGVSSVAAVATLGFGKAAPRAGYPAIYLTGIVGGVQGVFLSTDEGASWVRINDDSEQYGWIGQTITGDPKVFGRVYLGTNGRGIRYADPAGGGEGQIDASSHSVAVG